MPFSRPTILEIQTRLRADFKSQLPDFDPYLPRSVIAGLINSYAGAVHELNGRLELAARNAFADTADLEDLKRIGEIHGVTQWGGAKTTAAFVYLGTESTVIPAGTFHTNANGYRYTNPILGTVNASGFVAISVEAVDIGTEYNMGVGTVVELEEPITGITPGSGESPLGGHDGANAQSDDEYRAAVLAQLRRRPQGGTRYDFERWVYESSSEWTRVWILDPATGSNLISVYCVDDTLDEDGNLIAPIASHYTATEDYIKTAYRRPLCADVQVQSPSLLVDIDPNITLTPNTTDVQEAIAQEIIQFLIREAEIGGTLIWSALNEVISRAAGETDHTLTSPSGNVALSAGQLHVIGQPVFS